MARGRCFSMVWWYAVGDRVRATILAIFYQLREQKNKIIGSTYCMLVTGLQHVVSCSCPCGHGWQPLVSAMLAMSILWFW